jgi:hypothetical protein
LNFSRYKTEWLLLLLAVISVIVSIICDLQSIENTTWFARSGSIVVLLAAIVEYRLTSFVYEDVDQAAIKTAQKRAVMPSVSDNPLVDGLVKARLTSKPVSTKSRSMLSVVSLILIVAGTVIWGYGDIWVN